MRPWSNCVPLGKLTFWQGIAVLNRGKNRVISSGKTPFYPIRRWIKACFW